MENRDSNRKPKQKLMSDLSAAFKTISSVRRTLAYILSKTSLEMLNHVPEGFSNNIIWNVAHILSVQQLLVNRRSGAGYTESKEITQQYRPGTSPVENVTAEFVAELQERLIANVDDMEAAYNNGVYGTYERFETRTKMSLDSVEDAILFDLFHEGIHMGQIVLIQKALAKLES